MPFYSRNKDLFRNTTVKDKLGLFQNLLEAKDDLNADLALALLKAIHKDLSTPQAQDRSPYKHYAETIESLRHRMPGLLKQVADSWKANRNGIPDDWFR